MKIIHQVIIPVLILVSVAVTIHMTRNGVSENILDRHNCANWGWENRAHSEILFIGSSRSYRAVNIAEVRRALNKNGHDIKNIEMVYSDFPNLLLKIWATQDYLGSGAKPDIIIIENSMAQRARDFKERQEDGILTLLPVSQRYMPDAIYNSLQSHLNDRIDHAWTRIFRAGYTSAHEFKINRWRAIIYDFLDAPNMALSNRDEYCPDIFKSWNTNFTEDRQDEAHESVGPENHDSVLEIANNFYPYEPTSEARNYEITMMEYLLNMVRQHDPKKVYVWFPGEYSLAYNEKDHQEFIKLYDQADRVIWKDVIDLLKQHDRQKVFYNENHLNHTGRDITTQMWVDILSEDLESGNLTPEK